MLNIYRLICLLILILVSGCSEKQEAIVIPDKNIISELEVEVYSLFNGVERRKVSDKVISDVKVISDFFALIGDYEMDQKFSYVPRPSPLLVVRFKNGDELIFPLINL